MKEKNDVVLALLGQTLKTCKEHYASFEESLSRLDTKAQNTVAIAGVFIAGIFALIKADGVDGHPAFGQETTGAFLGASTAALLGSVVSCLVGMFIRRVPQGPGPGDILTLTQAIKNTEMDTSAPETYAASLETQIELWKKPLREISRKAKWKAGAVAVGQALLAASIALIAAMILLLLRSL